MNGHSRPWYRRWWLWMLLGLAAIYVVWWILTPITWNTIRTQSYPSGIEIRKVDYHELCANIIGSEFIWPFPYYNVVPAHEVILLVKGREVLRNMWYNHMVASPTGTFVVAEEWNRTKPIRIYDASGTYKIVAGESLKKEVAVPCDEVTVGFTGWKDDESFLVEVIGRSYGLPRESPVYHQVWQIDAKTAAATHAE